MSMHDASIPQKSPALKPTFPNHKICKNKTRVLPERLQKLKCTITPPLPPPISNCLLTQSNKEEQEAL